VNNDKFKAHNINIPWTVCTISTAQLKECNVLTWKEKEHNISLHE